MRERRVANSWATVAAVVALITACRPAEPVPRPVGDCAESCARLTTSCDERACERGCRFAYDRLVEHETAAVLACVARAKTCDDPVWAECGARVGPHADGGPPAPVAHTFDDAP